MTSRKQFDEWIADKHATPLFKSYAWAGWQAAERDALELAAQMVEEFPTELPVTKQFVASRIRALIEQDAQS